MSYRHFTISTTAKQTGYGSEAHHKRVSGLTEEEKNRIRAGDTVFFRAERLSQRGPAGTLWRYVKLYGHKGFYPRVPAKDTIEQLRAATGQF